MADAPKNQSCGNCRYYRREWTATNANQQGECGRYPPLQKDTTIYPGVFPSVSRYNWCGEYAPANPAAVSEAATTIARMVLMGDATAAYALIDKLQEDRPTQPANSGD